MVEKVIKTLICCQKSVSDRQRSFEVFGFDFMIDDRFGVWVIEVNSSPSNDMRCEVTRKLVPEFQRAVVRWAVDYDVFGGGRGGVDLGGLVRVYREEAVSVEERVRKRFGK